MFAKVKPLIENARYEGEGAVGYPQLAGAYRDLPSGFSPSSTRSPSENCPLCWLLVTIPTPLPLHGTFDLMMRPAGPTTFSNFDHLPADTRSPP